MTRLVYAPVAVLDVQEAFGWYDRQRPGLGEEFLDELRAAEERVRETPAAFRVIHRDARRCLLRRFPYQLIYQIVDDVVVVVACFHIRRNPDRIRRRT